MATINDGAGLTTPRCWSASDYGIELEKKIDKTAEEALEEEDFDRQGRRSGAAQRQS